MWRMTTGRSASLTLSLGSFLLGLGVALLVWASTELRGGLAAVPSHWWSGLPLVVCVVGLMMVAAALMRLRSADPGEGL